MRHEGRASGDLRRCRRRRLGRSRRCGRGRRGRSPRAAISSRRFSVSAGWTYDEAEEFRIRRIRKNTPAIDTRGATPHRRLLGFVVAEDAASRIVWCNCPHMTGFDALEVEDLTRADFEGESASLPSSIIPALERAGLRELLRGRCRPAARRAPDAHAGRRLCGHQGRRDRARAFPRHVARGRDYYTPYRALLPTASSG